MDLPKSKLGVDIENDFAPEYHVIQGKAKVLDEIKKAAKDKENVYLAPDPDREGEAIAWHIAQKLGPRRKNVHRVLFNERVTKIDEPPRIIPRHRCAKCGYAINAEWRACPNCGHVLSAA